jgi:hypothetical protein
MLARVKSTFFCVEVKEKRWRRVVFDMNQWVKTAMGEKYKGKG